MVGAPAAADAVHRAKSMPGLRVGLHLVVIEGPATLPPSEIPQLVDAQGRFPSAQLRLGIHYFFRPTVRRQLATEIRAQFSAFAATGLTLDHANAHKHMHLHPTVGRMLIHIGREFGLRAVRVPAEPPKVMAACGEHPGLGDRALHLWSWLLRAQIRWARMLANDHVFGIAWSGAMTTDRLRLLARNLPEGLSEIYFHPAAGRDPTLDALMPQYQHEAELAALLDPWVLTALAHASLTSYTAEVNR